MIAQPPLAQRLSHFTRPVLLGTFAALLTTLAACNSSPRTNQPDDAEIQRKSAEATAKVKAGAEKAADAAKPMIANAARRLDDVAAGVKQGMGNDAPSSKPSAGRLDLNSASASQIANLPGISDATADAIVAGRPYASTRQLVRKGIITQAQYQRIAGRVEAK